MCETGGKLRWMIVRRTHCAMAGDKPKQRGQCLGTDTELSSAGQSSSYLTSEWGPHLYPAFLLHFYILPHLLGSPCVLPSESLFFASSCTVPKCSVFKLRCTFITTFVFLIYLISPGWKCKFTVYNNIYVCTYNIHK